MCVDDKGKVSDDVKMATITKTKQKLEQTLSGIDANPDHFAFATQNVPFDANKLRPNATYSGSASTDISIALETADLPHHNEERGSMGELIPHEKLTTQYLRWKFSLATNEVTKATSTTRPSEGASTSSLLAPKYTIHPAQGKSPMLLFINAKSGGGSGKRLGGQLRKKMQLHACQYYEIGSKCNPKEGLNQFFRIDHTIVVMGGDGTIGWVMQEMNSFSYTTSNRPQIVVIPLGTGNDLGRTLGCGNGVVTFRGVMHILKGVGYSPVAAVALDQWKVSIQQPALEGVTDALTVTPTASGDTNLPSCRVRDSRSNPEHTTRYFNNYFSLGYDALVALKFHNGRENHSFMYNFQYQNLLMYGIHALGTLCDRLDLPEDVEVTVDGKKLEIPKGMKGLVLVNIPSYAGGIDLWGKKFKPNDTLTPQKLDDGLIEVVGVGGFWHTAFMKMGMKKGKRLAQGRKVGFKIKNDIPVQYDGEPFILSSSEVQISVVAQHQMGATSSKKC